MELNRSAAAIEYASTNGRRRDTDTTVASSVAASFRGCAFERQNGVDIMTVRRQSHFTTSVPEFTERSGRFLPANGQMPRFIAAWNQASQKNADAITRPSAM